MDSTLASPARRSARTGPETVPSGPQVSAETTVSSDTAPLAVCETPYNIIIKMNAVQLKNLGILSGTIGNEGLGSSKIDVRLEFNDDEYEIVQIGFSFDFRISLTAKKAQKLRRILIYDNRTGAVALRATKSESAQYRAVACFPIDDSLRTACSMTIELDVAIGVIAFTVRATNDIIRRNYDIIKRGLEVTAREGSEYVPHSLFAVDRHYFFDKIGGIWRSQKTGNIYLDIAQKTIYEGTGEGDLKVPIGENFGSIHRIGFNGTKFNVRTHNSTESQEKEPIYFYDVWANLSFGYFLKQCGYSPDGACNFAIRLGGIFGDDKSDQIAIRTGASLMNFDEQSVASAVSGKKDFFYNKRERWTPLCVS